MKQAILPKWLEKIWFSDSASNMIIYKVTPWSMYADKRGRLWLQKSSLDRHSQYGNEEYIKVIEGMGLYTCDIAHCRNHRWFKTGEYGPPRYVPVYKLVGY